MTMVEKCGFNPVKEHINIGEIDDPTYLVCNSCRAEKQEATENMKNLTIE